MSDDAELFERSLATLVRSWVYLASGSPGARVLETGSAAAAIFVHSPDRLYLNNALLTAGIEEIGETLEAVERPYAERGIDRFAVWAHEGDAAMRAAILARGYRYDSSTRTMALEAADLIAADTSVLDLAEPDLAEFWRVVGVEGLAPDLSPQDAHFYLSRLDGHEVAGLMAFDHDGDCGIYMVGTAPAARRRGIATALSAHALTEAFARGCTTASLQATPMAEGVYASVGFRDLGRFEEFVPGP